VASARTYKRERGVRTPDIAKRLLDDGFYPPTVYWPRVVEECLMTEPTETEDKVTLDCFAAALHAIAREAVADPALVKGAPHETLVGRIDETRAARQPDLRWRAKGSQSRAALPDRAAIWSGTLPYHIEGERGQAMGVDRPASARVAVWGGAPMSGTATDRARRRDRLPRSAPRRRPM